MKKRMFVVLIVMLVGTGSALFAATTDSASITLTGVVEPVVEVTITEASGYDSLDLTADATDLLVATVNEYCNVAAGYTVTLSSAYATTNSTENPGFSSGSVSDTLEYTLSYGGNAVTFSGGEATVTPSGTKTTAAGVDNSVTISYAASSANLSAASDYTDTLTFEITAN